jgi:hypothetical protein
MTAQLVMQAMAGVIDSHRWEELPGLLRSDFTALVQDRLQHFEVATFITVRDELIDGMTEAWTDVDEVASAGTGPNRYTLALSEE